MRDLRRHPRPESLLVFLMVGLPDLADGTYPQIARWISMLAAQAARGIPDSSPDTKGAFARLRPAQSLS